MVTRVNLCDCEDYTTRATGASYLMLVNNETCAEFCTVFSPLSEETDIQEVATELVEIYTGSNMDVWAVFPESKEVEETLVKPEITEELVAHVNSLSKNLGDLRIELDEAYSPELAMEVDTLENELENYRKSLGDTATDMLLSGESIGIEDCTAV